VRAEALRAASVRGALLVALALILAGRASSQSITNLQTNQPTTLLDAIPVDYRAFSGAVDYQYESRRDKVNFSGFGLALDYGFYRGFEIGASTRYVDHPRINADRGISSGDLDLHLLGTITGEDDRIPATAIRVDIVPPTGLASRGTDVSATAIATKSFDGFRIHGNLEWTVVGQPGNTERQNLWKIIGGSDWNIGGPWNTDSLLVADAFVRQSVRKHGRTNVGVEIGLRRRMGMQTVLLLGVSSEVAGDADRQRFRLLAGFAHAF
jgi:hypothetical protein